MSKAEALPLADVRAEAERLLSVTRAEDLPVRLLGGLAVHEHTEQMPFALVRAYGDIDIATVKAAGRPVGELLARVGYEPSREFNALNGDRRMVFHDAANARKLDVFVGTFEMCHTIPITARLDADPTTIPLAELLLTKLQVVELTEKDLHDTVALLHGHEVGDHDDETINGAVVARLTAEDWGLWRTVKLNVDVIRDRIDATGVEPDVRRRVLERLETLCGRIDEEPKSRAWRLRARVGERKRWYELPDET